MAKSFYSDILLRRRYVILSNVILLFLTGVIIEYYEQFLFFFWGFLLVSFVVSFILIYQKNNWKKNLVTLFVYITSSILIFVISASLLFAKERFLIGDRDFYDKEVYKTTKIIIPKSLQLIYKLDPIPLFFNGEFDSECIYSGSEKSIGLIKKQLLKDKSFFQLESSEILSKTIESKLLKSNIEYKKYKYWFENDADRYKVYIGINDNSMYFKDLRY